jgi:hypothetical protein
MSMAARVIWVQSFQVEYVGGGWFNAFEGFIMALRDEGYGPGSWVSTVDARVLANMKNGYRLYRGDQSFEAPVQGTAEFHALMVAILDTNDATTIKRLHTEAEQASVDYGQREAEALGRRSTLGEQAMLLAANQWRSLTHESALIQLTLRGSPVAVLGLLADWGLDPRNRDLAYEGARAANRATQVEPPVVGPWDFPWQ